MKFARCDAKRNIPRDRACKPEFYGEWLITRHEIDNGHGKCFSVSHSSTPEKVEGYFRNRMDALEYIRSAPPTGQKGE